MGFFRGVGKMVKPLVNVPKWMNSKQISSDATYIKALAQKVFKAQKGTRKEDFPEALERLDLSETDVKQRYKEFRRLAIIFGFIFILLIVYVVYLLSGLDPEVSWRAIALSLVVSLIALTQFLRFHYWVYQIKRRKLGCSFKDYFLHGLLHIKSGVKS